MNRTCKNCASERVVPVLDKRIENRARAGNKFRTRCLHCGHWNPLASRADFVMSAAADEKEAYVLPADGDPEEVDSIVLVEEFDGNISELREDARIADVPETESDKEEPPIENSFHCPADGCDAENTGHPDECSECGTPYSWPEEVTA